MEKKTADRLFFVGVHNKSPFKPLDRNSASGKRLQAAIDLLEFDGEIVKTNLFDCEYLPTNKDDISKHGDEWLSKYEPKEKDIIVLLGAAVQDSFPPTDSIIIKNGHPSPMFSKVAGEDYALRLAIKITDAISTSDERSVATTDSTK